MSAQPVDVLAVMQRDAVCAEQFRRSVDREQAKQHARAPACDEREPPEPQAPLGRGMSDSARAAVAELFAADKEYDERRVLLAQAVKLMEREGSVRAADLEAAVYHEARAADRRAAALATCGVKS